MRVLESVLLFCSVILSTPALGQSKPQPLPDIQQFAKFDLWHDFKISPNGAYISANATLDGKNKLIIFDRRTFNPLYRMAFRYRYQSGEHHWVSNTRLIVEKQYLRTYRERPVSHGIYHSLNFDGGQSKHIFGYRNLTVGQQLIGRGYLLDPMVDDDRFAIFVGEPYDRFKDTNPVIHKVNVFRGWSEELYRSPVKKAQFLTSKEGKVQFVSGYNHNNEHQVYLMRDGQWVNSKYLNIATDSFKPVSYDQVTGQLYASHHPDGGPEGLYRFDLNNGDKEVIFQHPSVAINQVKKDRHGNIYAVTYDDGYPATVIVDGSNAEAKVLKRLMKRTKGQNLEVVSQTAGGNLKILLATNQYNPGEYLLYNVKTDSLVMLQPKRSWYDPASSATVMPFKFKNREGTEILAYVTLPKGVETIDQAKALPFVVSVHNGLHDSRDWMVYNSENQLLASRGIGVLQVNYRGSEGFGKNFKQAAFGHWHDLMQHDIIDGANALVAEGIADKNRLCISGAGVGGYSAVQSALLAPSLFKCAIAMSGVYDLEMILEHSKTIKSDIDRQLLIKAIGTDPAQLKAASVVNRVDRLKTPLLLIHGNKDKWSPYAQVKKLKKALDMYGKDYQWLLFDKAGHGIYTEEHRSEVFEASLSFLTQHLLNDAKDLSN